MSRSRITQEYNEFVRLGVPFTRLTQEYNEFFRKGHPFTRLTQEHNEFVRLGHPFARTTHEFINVVYPVDQILVSDVSNAPYTQYCLLTINKNYVSGFLMNYVLYVNLADVENKDVFFQGCTPSGGDIRVSDDNMGTYYAREIVDFDQVTQTGHMWVLLPHISNTVDTKLRIFFNGISDEPDASSSYGVHAVWANYTSVHHMNQSPIEEEPQIIDSTQNFNNGYCRNGLTSDDALVQGQVGKALFIDANKYIEMSDNASFDIVGELSLQAWVKKDDLITRSSGIVSKYIGSHNQRSYCLYVKEHQCGCFGICYPDGSASSLRTLDGVTSINDGVFHKLTGVFVPNTSLTLYFDGVQDAQDMTNIPPAIYSGSGLVRINTFDDPYRSFIGIIDEVRIRAGVISAEHELTEYNNQSDTSTFYTIGEILTTE